MAFTMGQGENNFVPISQPPFSILTNFLPSRILKILLLPFFIPSISPEGAFIVYIKPRSTLDNFFSIILLPRLLHVCLDRCLVGYWRGYFNHKRCRRRCDFKFRTYIFLKCMVMSSIYQYFFFTLPILKKTLTGPITEK